MSAVPTRLLISGQTDVNGAASIPFAAPPTKYAVFTFVGQVDGNPSWTISVGGQLLRFGNGPAVNLGPLLTAPGERLTVAIAGATPGVQVTGTFDGNQYSSAEEAAASYRPTANTITVNTFAQQRQIDSFTQAPNVVVSNRLYLLPTGTQSVRIQLNQNAQNVTFAGFKVLGAQSGIIYVFPSSGSGTSGGFDDWFKPAPVDLAGGVLFSLDTTGSASGVEVEITADLGQSFVIASLTGAGTSNGQPILVTNSGTPAPWQAGTIRQPIAATSVAGAGGVLVLIAGTAGKTIHPSRFSFFQDGANAAGRFDLEETSAAGLIHSMQCTNVRGLLDRGTLEGIATGIPVGAGIQVANAGAANSFISGFIDYQLL